MCTLSWRLSNNKYEVFFNRDEQHRRAKAIAPGYDQNTHSIYPLDPQGGGTWMSVNGSGLTLCLMNNYQAQASKYNKHPKKSRGQIIPELIKNSNSRDVEAQLKKMDLNSYAPFLLCIFTRTSGSLKDGMPVFIWDGQNLEQRVQSQPIISSSVSVEEVTNERRTLFGDMVLNADTSAESHLNYHRSHRPTRGKLSVCMHRSDAATQSLSHIEVGEDIRFSYHDGPPCENAHWSDVLIPTLTVDQQEKSGSVPGFL